MVHGSFNSCVCRTLQEIRNGRDDGVSRGNQAPPSQSFQDDECRIQQDLVEMLTVKLAKKEKENELFRLQQVLPLKRQWPGSTALRL